MTCARISMIVALAVVLGGVCASVALCDEPPTSSQESSGQESVPAPEGAPPSPTTDTGYYAVDVCRETDPGGQQMTGLRFSAGVVGERGSGNDGHGETSVTVLAGDGQHTYRAEVGVALTLFAIKELLVAPRLGAGVEYRTSPPDDGWAGLLGFGVEFSGWVKRKVEWALFVDRKFGFPSGTRTHFGLAVRWAGKRLPWWPKPKTGQEPEKAGQPAI